MILAGHILGERFAVRRRLGSGGMGEVFEALDRDREDVIAIKALTRADGAAFARFKREFRALQSTSHPNLVSLGELVCVGETIVFYRTAIAAWLLAVMAGRTARISDLVVVLTLAFLAFGRVGCFRVACCHGRPARFGVRYTHAHARLGFPRRWVGRPLVPVQLFEAVASAVLAVAGVVLLVRGAAPGTATKILIVGYARVRFPLELLRGDGARPHAVAVVRGPAAGTRRGCTRARPRARCRDHRRHVARALSRAAPNNGAQDSPSCAP